MRRRAAGQSGRQDALPQVRRSARLRPHRAEPVSRLRIADGQFYDPKRPLQVPLLRRIFA